MRTLSNRIDWAKANLERVEPQYCIVWFDPDDPQEVAHVTIPSGEWLAMAMHGGLLPSIEAYEATRYNVVADGDIHEDISQAERDELLRNRTASYSEKIIDYSAVHASTIDPMTEEEAMEYLLQKDVPRHVWSDFGRTNRQKFVICRRDQVPKDRSERNAWRLIQ